MNEIQLVTIDLDGTLLSKQKEISDEASNLIKELSDSGTYITLATGRTFESARSYYEQLDLAVPIITSNGARILDQKRVYKTYKMSVKTIREVIEEAVSKELSVIYTIDGLEYTYNITPWIEFQRREKNQYMRDHKFSEAEWENIEIEKLLIWNDNVESSVDIIKPTIIKYIDDIHAVQYANRCYEITDINASKLNATKYLADYYGIPMENVMHIGDDVNDITLLMEAGFSVAPANSHEEALKVAKYHSKLERTEAVIEALNIFVKQNKG